MKLLTLREAVKQSDNASGSSGTRPMRRYILHLLRHHSIRPADSPGHSRPREASLAFFTIILPIFAVFGLGYLLGRLRGADSRTLVGMAIYLFVPALVFTKTAEKSFSLYEAGGILLFSFASTALVYLITALAARIMRVDRVQRYALLLGTVSMNGVNFGLPVVQFAVGDDALPYAAIFITGASLIQATVLVYLAAAGRHSVRQSLASIFRIPIVYAFIAGMAISIGGFHDAIPGPVMMPFRVLADAAVPVGMVILGMQLTRVRLDGEWRSMGTIALIRLVISPLIGIGLAALLGFEGKLRSAVILETAMPTAVNAALLAAEFDTKPSFVAGTVLVTTLLSALTLTVLIPLLVG